MKRLAIFAHFDADGIVDDYVLHYLRQLKPLADVIFVSASNIDFKSLEKIASLCIHQIHSAHNEYDFGSYKRGFKWAEANQVLAEYDWLFLLNDSMFGPFHPLDEFVTNMEAKNCDFWGFTRNTLDTTPHLQSYFVALNRKIISSDYLSSFLDGVKHHEIRKEIIIHYEHGLSELLEFYGHPWAAVYEEGPDKFDYDPTKNWDLLIDSGYPFLKKSLFTRNIYSRRNLHTYKEVVGRNSPSYNLRLIEMSLERSGIRKLPIITRYEIKKLRQIFISLRWEGEHKLIRLCGIRLLGTGKYRS